MKLAIVIPAYNEEGSIIEVLNKIPTRLKGISEIIPIVVDDGSTDKTYDLAKGSTKHVARHVVNLGLGAALTTGFETAKKLNCDFAVTLDGDGQHNPNDIERIIGPILKKKADVVIGTRMKNTAGMPPIKIFGNWAMNLITFIVFRQWSSDSQSGMRVLGKKALKKMVFHSVGYEISSEIIGEIKRSNLKLQEVPIEVIYSDYSMIKGQNIFNAINIFTRIIVIKIVGRK